MRQPPAGIVAVGVFVLVLAAWGVIGGVLSICRGDRAEGVSNFLRHDRSDDWTARDLAHNLLTACDSCAVLVTAGDNDTFPLWYLQLTEGFRTDVLIVPRSVMADAATFRNLATQFPAPDLPPDIPPLDATQGSRAGLGLPWPPEGKVVSLAGFSWRVPPSECTPDSSLAYLSPSHHRLLLLIAAAAAAHRPVNFSAALSPEEWCGLDGFLIRIGIVYRLDRVASPDGQPGVDIPSLSRMLDTVYRYRGVESPPVGDNPGKRSLRRLYAEAYAALAEGYCAVGDSTGAAMARDRARGFERR